jgi:integrase
MRGSVKWQVQEIFKKSGVNRIGAAKHAAKAYARFSLNADGKAADWHNIGKKIGIHSYATADAYRDVWRRVLKFAKSEFKVKDIEKLQEKHVQAYLESRIVDKIAHATFLKEAAACEKLETALNGYAERRKTGNSYAFSRNIEDARSDAHTMLWRFKGTRAYKAPRRLVAAVTNPDHRLVARMQYESGARVSECNHLKKDNLRGFSNDPVTKEKKGVIHVIKAKGGLNGEKYVSPAVYQKLERAVQAGGRFEFNKNMYRNSLRTAAEATGQIYYGSHGLRWNFAQKRFQTIQQWGYSYEKAMAQVSFELMHQRADITLHYLK